MAEVVEDFYIHFTQVYNRLRNEQLQLQQTLIRRERMRRSRNKVNALTTY